MVGKEARMSSTSGFVLFFVSFLAVLLMIVLVFAASFTITISQPETDDNFYPATIALINITTSDNTNCTFSIINDSGVQLGPTELPLDDSTEHNVSNVNISSIADGFYNLSIYCLNASDVDDNDTAVTNFTKDTVSPVIYWLAPANDSYGVGNVTLDAVFTDSLPIAIGLVTFTTNCGGVISDITCNESGPANVVRCNATWDTTTASKGICTLNATAPDFVFNEGQNNSLDVNIDLQCGETVTESKTLEYDITSCAGAGLILNASNVTLDCNGHLISGPYATTTDMGVEILPGNYNITVKNCTVAGYTDSVGIGGLGLNSDDGDINIISNTLYDVDSGIKLQASSAGSNNYIITNNLILNTTDVNISGAGIYVRNSGNLYIDSNTVYDSEGAGIDVSPSVGTFSNNVVNNSGYVGILLATTSNSVIQGNNVSYSRHGTYGFGLLVTHAETENININITENNLINNDQQGLELVAGAHSGVLVWHNNIYDNRGGLGNWQIYSPAAIELSYNNEGNYWGRSSCPLFIGGTDSTAANVTDSYPYNETSAWDLGGSPDDCRLTCGETLTTSWTMTENDDLTSCMGGTAISLSTGVILDCNGYEISGDGATGTGVDLSDSTQVKNCIIHDVAYGLSASGPNNMVIDNNTIYNTESAIYLSPDSGYVNITNNSIYDSSDIAINFYGGSTNVLTIEDNEIQEIANYGMYFDIPVTGNSVINRNTINNVNDGIGIYAIGLDNVDFIDNDINGSYNSGIIFDSSSNNTISGGEIGNNNLGSGSHGGIYLTSSSNNNTITGVYMHDNAVLGAIAIDDSEDNILEGNNINNNCGNIRQIYLNSAGNTLIQNNNITDGTGKGIEIQNSEYTQILNNNITGNFDVGIYEEASSVTSAYTTISGNIISDNSEQTAPSGAVQFSSVNATLTDNNFTVNSGRGIYAQSSYITMTNGNFIGNGFGSDLNQYAGIYGDEIHWTLTEAVECTDNNINITSGSITGIENIVTDNCTIEVNGIIYETTAPTLAIYNPANTTYYANQSIIVDFNASDSGAGVDTIWYVDGGTRNTVMVNAGAVASYRLISNTTYDSDIGSVVFEFYANDSWNNIANENLTFSVALQPANSSVVNTSSVNVDENSTQLIVPYNSTLQNVTIPLNLNSSQIILDLTQLLSGTNVSLVNNFTLVRIDAYNYTVEIPSGTNVTGAAVWDGLLYLPIINSTTFTAPSLDNYTTAVNVVIDLGSTSELTFSQPVKIIIGGMAGKRAAWARGSATLTDISTRCTSATVPGITSGECYYDSGTDLIIWTYHFTSFAAYTPTAVVITATTTSSSGGGCTTTWNCTDWGECIDGMQTRNCSKERPYCYAPPKDKPSEQRECAVTPTGEIVPGKEIPTAEPGERKIGWVMIASIALAVIIVLVVAIVIAQSRSKLKKLRRR